MQVLLERARTRRKPPILLKIAPDLTEEQKADIAAVVLAKSEVQFDDILTAVVGD